MEHKDFRTRIWNVFFFVQSWKFDDSDVITWMISTRHYDDSRNKVAKECKLEDCGTGPQAGVGFIVNEYK